VKCEHKLKEKRKLLISLKTCSKVIIGHVLNASEIRPFATTKNKSKILNNMIFVTNI